MARDHLVILGLLAAGFAYGLLKKRQGPGMTTPTWVGLGLVGVLIAGFTLALALKIEALVWVFGLSLMAVVPLLMLWAVGAAIGRLVRKRKHRDGQAAPRPDT